MEQFGDKGPFFFFQIFSGEKVRLFDYCSACPHPTLLNLNEMKCSWSPLYNDTKFTSISVQIRTKFDQYEQVQGRKMRIIEFRLFHPYFIGNCTISRQRISIIFLLFCSPNKCL